ncbi:metallophosphoesterase family protein [Arenibacter amylolyticus]|uniref:metallophosphoesterase family protein n=1 Tax=Arenibacter amylolyticus TaxID=1406873 RepID=UPI000A384955|nr:metallophosphoesterase [Arenibacter amylolyticus]
MKKICFLSCLFITVIGLAQENRKIAFGPYIQQMGTKDATICWSTKVSEPTITDPEGNVKTITEYKHHKIHLGRLKPNTEYSYDVLNDGTDEGKGTLTTYPDEMVPFNFAVTGDSRSRHDVHAKVVAKIMETNPRFIVNSGDLVSNGRSIEDWEAFFEVSKELMRNTPYYPVLGNHEKDSPYYYDLFDLPNNEKYYYFTVGDALMIVLDSEGKEISQPTFVSDEHSEAFWKEAFSDYFVEQKKWLEKVLDLNREAGFVFIFQHKPLFSVMKNRKAEAEKTREFWGDIFERHKVQVFFNGHDHHYHRAFKNGVHYITSAGAGAPLYDVDFELPETEKFSKVEHFVNVQVQKDKAVLLVTDIDGNEIETVEVKRRMVMEP